MLFLFPLEIVSNKTLENTWRQLSLEAIVTLSESGNIKNLSLGHSMSNQYSDVTHHLRIG